MSDRLSPRKPPGRLLAFLICCLGLNPPLLLSAPPEVNIPPESGTVESRFISEDPEKPLVILIQDVHAHYEAQKSLAAILNELIDRHGLDLVLVEGGVGDVDLSSLAEGVPPEHAQAVAERYLKAGKISGEEFLDLTPEGKALRLWGLEDPLLYRRNMEAYLQFAEAQKEALEEVQRLQAQVRELQNQHYPKELNEIELLREKVENRQFSLLVYFNLLAEKASSLSLPLEDFPTFRQWLEIRKKEAGLDPGKLEWEKKELAGALSRALTKEELYPLRNEWKNSGFGSESSYLQTLLQFKKEYQPKFDRYSTVQIEKALHLMEEARRLDAGRLFDEADLLYREIRNQLLPPGEARTLADLSDYTALVDKLFHLQWRPQELEQFEALRKRWDPESAQPLLPGENDLERIGKRVPEAARFYEVAREREEAIFKNALLKMKENPKNLYALIVGGFHARHLTERFKAEGFSVMSVRPRFELSEEPTPYFQVLREKWGEGEAWPPAAS